MTTTKKTLRFLSIFVLIFAMVLSIASVPASAAGVETWYATDDYIFENEFTIRGYNLTPVKTMGSTGTLNLIIAALEFTDASSNSNPVNFRYEIRSNGTVLLSGTETLTNDELSFAFWTRVNVTAGQKIQVYISAYDAVTGNYRTARVEYGHWLDA